MVQISIIPLSKIEGATRVDAEYYEPKYLNNDSTLRHYKNGYYELHEILRKGTRITGGATPLGANYLKEGEIKFIRVQNVMENYLDLSDVVYIDSSVHNGLLRRSRLRPNDVLLTITGVSYGKSATVPTSIGEANINQHSVRIAPNSDLILPRFLSTFLNCKYGKLQTDRKITGFSRPGLGYPELNKIIVPKVDMSFQGKIQQLVIEANQFLDKATQLYLSSEKELLKEVPLEESLFKQELAYTKNLSECDVNKRIDAEYYQPKYELVLRRVKDIARKNMWNIKTIKELSEPLRYGSSEKLTYLTEGIPFLRITDIHDLDFDRDALPCITEEEAKKVAYARVREGDMLISRSGTLGLTVSIRKDLEDSVFGSYFIRIRPKVEIDHDYLASYLNSIFGKIQVQQISTGAIQTNLTIPVIENMRVLIPSKEFQERIASLLIEARSLREKGKKYLIDARTKVEHEIGNMTS